MLPYKNDLVTKALSGVTSRTSDASAVKNIRKSYPHFFQDRIYGAHTKIHCWLNKGRFHNLSVTTTSLNVDPRNDPELTYQKTYLPDNIKNKLTDLSSNLDCCFFDIDFIDKNGELFFLEVNFSPAPAWYESRFTPPNYTFSEQILSDWLLDYA